MRHKQLYFCIILMVVIAFMALWTKGAEAREKSVVEEILDILLSNHQISQQQYQYLLNKAKVEEIAREEKSQEKTLPQEMHASKWEKKGSPNRVAQPIQIYTYWKKGLTFETEDQDVVVKIGGRIHIDSGHYDKDEIGSGSKIRRARLSIKGRIHRNIDFEAEYDFSGGKVKVKDLYMGLRKVPYVGSLRIGHMKEPFSLEELSNGNSLTFMERGLPNALVPGRNIGLLLHNSGWNKRLTWSLGGFSETDNKGNGFGKDNQYNVTGRITALPWYKDGGKRLIHLGLSYSHKSMDKATSIRFNERPESHLTDVKFLDTEELELIKGKKVKKNISSDRVDLVGGESALVFGPFSLQGEYIRAFVNSTDGENPNFYGYYIYGSYFLTGESRPYKKSKGTFSQVKPRRNFQLSRNGWGAWEIALRYSHLDLNDGGIRGGELGGYTVGLNWYLNPNVRVMFNYIHSDLDKEKEHKDLGDTNIFQTRFQIVF